MKIILSLKVFLVFFVFGATACTHRGLNLSEQLPEEFIQKYKKNGFDQNQDQIIGFIEQGAEINEENIVFLNADQRELYNRKKEDSATSVVLVNEKGSVFGKVDLEGFEKNSDSVVSVESYSEKASGFIKETKAAIDMKDEGLLVIEKSKSNRPAKAVKDQAISFDLVSKKSSLTMDKGAFGVVFYSAPSTQ